MTRLAIVFSLLFATPAWAGEVDGNSFYCEPDPTNKKDKGLDDFTKVLEFADDKARLHEDEGPGRGGPKHRSYPYRAYRWGVEFNDEFNSLWSINRETLRLRQWRYKLLSGEYQCRFMDLNKALRKQTKVNTRYMEKYNKKRKNKNQF